MENMQKEEFSTHYIQVTGKIPGTSPSILMSQFSCRVVFKFIFFVEIFYGRVAAIKDKVY